MVCILCDAKTRTTNSRYRHVFRQTWRRHTCTRCSAVFTTRESIELAVSYRFVTADGQLVPFERDKLFLDVHKSLEHRDNAVQDAQAITTTVLRDILQLHTLLVRRDEVIRIATQCLRRFNPACAVLFAAQHQIR